MLRITVELIASSFDPSDDSHEPEPVQIEHKLVFSQQHCNLKGPTMQKLEEKLGSICEHIRKTLGDK